MILVTDHLDDRPRQKTAIALRIDRHKLAKRRFRAQAEDGADFGFDLAHPLKHGDVFHERDQTVYQIDQLSEPVLRIPFQDAETAARYGWMVGNMHFQAAFEPGHILAEDDPAVRQLLDRNGVAYESDERVFQPADAASGHHHH